VDQSAKCAVVLAVGRGVLEARTGFLAMNADLAFLRERNQAVATPGAQRSGKRLNAVETFVADRQG
jgi:hypothetical protein